jgi:uncharacterized protein YoxC
MMCRLFYYAFWVLLAIPFILLFIRILIELVKIRKYLNRSAEMLKRLNQYDGEKE